MNIESLKLLRRLVPRGTVIYSVLRHTGRSEAGYRVYDLFVIRRNTPVRITHPVAAVLGLTLDRFNDGLPVRGGGDAFDLVHSVGRVLFPHGGTTKAGQAYTDGGYLVTHLVL